ncbi:MULTISPECIES: phosphoadenosine phosphosulfate reductase family protein [unclassified Niallia]|uniref:phosphoadenosine phosphosulfate reductase domain-containing protein n=1 Tax=unclassified Niallia TaxID=2837522 RepID=UPI0020421868|nr:phosphoadenosine phosphosulfate reductase family protein [Niallia sp. MER 6]MCM3030366.1 phosphoadenosine phosphosulfate reductase family protein [Niallia sp. MER 6]
MKTVAWFSGGVSSFISIYLFKDEIDEIYYLDVQEQHPDTYRFLTDCEKVLGREIIILKNEKTNSAMDIMKQRRYINGPSGAPCTSELKRKVRQRWEQTQEDILRYVWGYDSEEKHRAERLLKTTPEHEHVFPLINAMLTKDEVHGLLERLGIKRPIMYELGFRNNNCVGCVKGGMGYWNKIRKHFPERFKEMADLEREIGASCIKGCFLDELDPERGRIEDEIMGECGILCEIAYSETCD